MEIKALSIAGPYAYLLARGTKRIELRSWKTSYRGLVLLHCSASTSYDAEFVTWRMLPSQHPKSVIVGCAKLTDCIEYTSRQLWERDEEKHLFLGRFAEYPEVVRDCYGGKIPVGHVFENPIRFDKPIPCPGALNYWTPRNERQQRAFERARAQMP